MSSSLPPKLSPQKYKKAVAYAKLASRAYDTDDWLAARIGMAFFAGIDDISNQDFRTADYRRVRGGGNLFDWWGGDDQGLDYTLFEHQTTKDLVLSFRGTEPLSLEDWFEDAEQVLGGSEQYKAAVNLAKKIKAKVDTENKNKFKNIQLSFTGHSLGGGLATAAALATGQEAIVFDAAGISNFTIQDRELGLDITNAVKVTNFNVKGCFVSDWNHNLDETTLGTCGSLISKQYGEIFWLESISERASFLPKGLLSRLLPGEPSDEIEAKAETFLAHAWHVFTYQLEQKNFECVQAATAGNNGNENKKRRVL